jgi:anthranilate phosphoribosyltransferase
VFNILGPLSHPGRLTRQVVGVSAPDLGPLVAGVLARRGSPHAWVVHGSDGLDELTLGGPSTVWAVADGAIEERTIVPADAGLEQIADGVVAGGGPERNADLFRGVLAGETGPVRDLVLLNAAAGLVVAGVAIDLAGGVMAGTEALADGSVEDLYRRLVEKTAELA